MLKVEHIGIAVRQLKESVPLFEKLLNTNCYKTRYYCKILVCQMCKPPTNCLY